MNIVDLRSDTVTKPTERMREAMAKAEVGDDVYGEDATINRLQEISAEMMGKEAGLFVPSGTMGNLSAVLSHCGRGDEVILGNQSHIFRYEAGGISALGGVHSFQVLNQKDGTLNLDEVAAAIRGKDQHEPQTRLVALENTQNRGGGTVLPEDYLQEFGDFAKERGLKTHLDGARLFNAAAASTSSPAELAAPFDSVTFCLSKGLCAPVGSVLCGSRAFIARAHRIRKQLGGGMRQAGILAAAGIVALEDMPQRLHEDHFRAQRMAEGLAKIPALVLNEGTPHTNMIFMRLADEVEMPMGEIIESLHKKYGVRVGAMSERAFRLVTHYWITDEAVAQTVAAFEAVLRG